VSGFYIVPDALYNAIQKRLDEAIAKCPDAAKDREALYHQLLDAFNQYGSIPEFELVPREPPIEEDASNAA
jgi:hypothetical protein